MAAETKEKVTRLVKKEEASKLVKGKKNADPKNASIDIATQEMITHIDKKRHALRIDRARERVMVDMAARRELAAI